MTTFTVDMDDAATTTCRARSAAFLAIPELIGTMGVGANDFLEEMLRCRDGAAQRRIDAMSMGILSLLEA